jgi:hypothetical protein
MTPQNGCYAFNGLADLFNIMECIPRGREFIWCPSPIGRLDEITGRPIKPRCDAHCEPHSDSPKASLSLVNGGKVQSVIVAKLGRLTVR